MGNGKFFNWNLFGRYRERSGDGGRGGRQGVVYDAIHRNAGLQLDHNE